MWYYENKEYNETPEEYQGFVYLITELDTAKSISVKRTSGGRKYYQKIQKETGGFGHEWNLTGRSTLAQTRKYKDWSNLKE